MARLKAVKKQIKEIKEYKNNPRNNDRAVDAVRESVKKFGYINPIIINAEDVILAGHTRLKALKEIGEKEVECIVVSHLSEEEEKAFRIADNRTAEFSSWDNDRLAAEMKEMAVDDWEKFGFNDEKEKGIRF